MAKVDKNSARALEIVETAARLFAGRGFDGVSVRDICSELSLNCSLISYYFGGKKGLYLAVLKQEFTAYGQALAGVAAKNLEPREALSALIDAMRGFASTHPYFAALATRESGNPSPEFLQAAREYENRFGDKLADILRGGQRQGVFPHLKISALSAAVNRLLNGPSLAEPSAVFSENDYFETVKTLLVNGLTAERTAESGRAIGKQSATPRNALNR